MSNEEKFGFLIKKKFDGNELEYHILEHIIIGRLKKSKKVKLSGFTTEDYMFFWGIGAANKNYILSEIESIKLSKSKIDYEFGRVVKESQKRVLSIIDMVWEDTIYANHPIGNITKLPKIDTIEMLKNNIKKNDFFFHSSQSNYSNHESDIESQHFNLAIKFDSQKTILYNNRGNKVLFFSGIPDLFHLISRLLQIYNTDLYIHISDKAKQNALIFDSSLNFPKYSQVDELLLSAKTQLSQEIDELKQDYFSLILTRLESIAYYGISWESRIQKVMQISNCQVHEVLNNILL